MEIMQAVKILQTYWDYPCFGKANQKIFYIRKSGEKSSSPGF